ncbi:RHS repeat-associated core domain-containing protein [Shewanella sp. YLB-07]|uniref:RHS repeat-associated core domain-containing protein n=1 Tax=Shewanella sp. YLB-07 TaxID=2601268 RepID=UPI00128B3F79|nr:RHS repeat-associated core domain-containing protein [Shewanella sp. YLB-07]MPY23762.1 RHS repeat-associated core domain-containing protein [Shewanella sp. YLB-07]
MKKILIASQHTSFPQLSIDASRRRFLKHSSVLMAASPLAGLSPLVASAAGQVVNPSAAKSALATNTLGFNGERKDPVTGCYHLGNGYRMYNPRLMRFHATDSMSPFGQGGINSYAYCLGDPINLKDPSGHFVLLSLLIGAIVGAIVGATISAAAEGVRAATTGTHFDWKQVAIGAALGFISGGFGAAAVGAKTGVQVGLAVADAVVSGAADFGVNVASGIDTKQAGINAGVGAIIGLATFGLGRGISKAGQSLSAVNHRIANVMTGGLSGDSKNLAGVTVWRADGRSPATIRKSGGFYNRSGKNHTEVVADFKTKFSQSPISHATEHVSSPNANYVSTGRDIECGGFNRQYRYEIFIPDLKINPINASTMEVSGLSIKNNALAPKLMLDGNSLSTSNNIAMRQRLHEITFISPIPSHYIKKYQQGGGAWINF